MMYNAGKMIKTAAINNKQRTTYGMITTVGRGRARSILGMAR